MHHSSFLNIASSLTGKSWLQRLTREEQGEAEAMLTHYGIDEILARVLAGRGVLANKAQEFFEPKLRDLMPDPSVLRDMDQATTQLVLAIETQKKIAIFGDYDVDGAASCVLLADYFQQANCEFILHIPDRILEGYGPNEAAIEGLRQAGCELLVVVDCGTTSFAPIRKAAELGLKPIIIDHHQAEERLPEALVVNPNRHDDLSGLGGLCAAGVVFLVLVSINRALRHRGFWNEMRREPDLMLALDLVGLATIADVVPLTGLNRAYVQRGLEIARQRQRIGLNALFEVAKASGPPNVYQMGFVIGPRINAGGRIGDAALGAKLLLQTNILEAKPIAMQLDRLNRDRQEIEAVAVAEASAQSEKYLCHAKEQQQEPALLIVHSEQWHPGVVGLVASRLKDQFDLPTFAVSFQADVGTGSGRSLTGVDLGTAVREAVGLGLLEKGGGHAMAAGIRVRRKNLDAFGQFMQERLKDEVIKARHTRNLFIDGAVTARALNADLAHQLEKAGPFGAANPEVVFVLPNHKLANITPVGKNHLRLRLKCQDGSSVEVMAFRAQETNLGRLLLGLRGQNLHFAVSLALNHYNGQQRVQTRLIDIAPPS